MLERRRATDIFQFMQPNPHINKAELTKWYLREQNLPEQLFQPQPPDSGPDPAKFSVSIKGEDLNPLSPQAPIIAELLVQFGLTISPGAIAKSIEIAGQMPATTGQPTEGGGIGGPPEQTGTAAPMSPLNKHVNDL